MTNRCRWEMVLGPKNVDTVDGCWIERCDVCGTVAVDLPAWDAGVSDVLATDGCYCCDECRRADNVMRRVDLTDYDTDWEWATTVGGYEPPDLLAELFAKYPVPMTDVLTRN